MLNKKGFVFIETIIVICVLTVSLMSLYANYEKIMLNTKELNTFDTTEYNYKTYFVKQMTLNERFDDTLCKTMNLGIDPHPVTCCKLKDVSKTDYLKSEYNGNDIIAYFDAYIIDYLETKEFDSTNDNIFLVEFKKEDPSNPDLFLTYISSLTY